MAFAQTTSVASFPLVYNVEQAVGNKSPNDRGDVRLVQYMLKHYYKAPELAVDGWIGPVTVGYIKIFQQEAKNQGLYVLQDGRVDRALGNVASISKSSYTILLLNAALKGRNPGAWAQVPAAVPLNPNPRPSPYSGEKIVPETGGY